MSLLLAQCQYAMYLSVLSGQWKKQGVKEGLRCNSVTRPFKVKGVHKGEERAKLVEEAPVKIH